MTRATHLLAALLALALVAAACGDDTTEDGATNGELASEAADDNATTSEADTSETSADDTDTDDTDSDDEAASGRSFPITVATDSGDITIDARPERIISMSSTATEILFAIGAGEQVEAVDSYSNYPAEAPITDLSAFEPNVEALAGYEPDLVILGFDNSDVTAAMADLGVPVIVQSPAATLDDTYDQIAQLGEVTGNLDGAAAVNAELRSEIDRILAEVPTSDEPVRVYHEIDDTFYSASSASFIGQLYDMLGYENIADAADPDGSGFPQLQVDQIIAADPTLIVFSDAYGYGADDIAARPGWDSLTAVAQGNVIEVDDDLSSRWGPRIVEFLEVIVASTRVATG